MSSLKVSTKNRMSLSEFTGVKDEATLEAREDVEGGPDPDPFIRVSLFPHLLDVRLPEHIRVVSVAQMLHVEDVSVASEEIGRLALLFQCVLEDCAVSVEDTVDVCQFGGFVEVQVLAVASVHYRCLLAGFERLVMSR